ncbi:MAG: hypothetical protein Q7R50_00235 [Dehalococcoidales bacterium]|nr:hypothetical protein [Dehalococcoidales bacterium]
MTDILNEAYGIVQLSGIYRPVAPQSGTGTAYKGIDAQLGKTRGD